VSAKIRVFLAKRILKRNLSRTKSAKEPDINTKLFAWNFVLGNSAKCRLLCRILVQIGRFIKRLENVSAKISLFLAKCLLKRNLPRTKNCKGVWYKHKIIWMEFCIREFCKI